jgi:hypothetical protein
VNKSKFGSLGDEFSRCFSGFGDDFYLGFVWSCVVEWVVADSGRRGEGSRDELTGRNGEVVRLEEMEWRGKRGWRNYILTTRFIGL